MKNQQLNSDQDQIALRQKYFFEGREYEQANDYKRAITSYIQYSEHLKKEDQHIPHQWISKLFADLGKEEESLHHQEVYAKGCSPPKASECYKHLGERYEKLDDTIKALQAYKKAIELNPSIGVKKKIEDLSK